MKRLRAGFTAPDGQVPPHEDDQYSLVILDIPGNGDTLRIRLAEDVDAPENYRFSFEAWLVDAAGKRSSDVVRGNGGSTPEDAMEISQWHRLRELPGPSDPVDVIVLPERLP